MIFRISNEIDKDWVFAEEMLTPSFCRIFQVDRLEDYHRLLKLRKAQLWIAEDENKKGAVITTIEEGGNGRLLAVRFLGGRQLKKWSRQMDEALTEFARVNSCRQITAVTRKGFSRLITSFKPQGLDLFIKAV